MAERIGPYEILGEIARGGAGVVYRARDAQLQRDVAIKLLLTGRGRPEAIRRLRREARSLARLRHPHVVAVLDVGEHQGVPYLVLEYVPGESLAQRLERLGPLEARDAAALGAELISALAHAHAQGVIHRDLKPANVLLDERGSPRLTDFGLAFDDSGLRSQEQRLSKDGAFLGTPGYWSPEQAYGQLDRIGPPTDVWGVGAVLYAALTGAPPYDGDSLPALLDALQSPPLAPSALRPGIPPALDALCLDCLRLTPAARPRLEALQVQLAALRGGQPTRGAVPRWALRALGAAALVAVGVGLALLGPGARAPATRPPPGRPAAASPHLAAAQLALSAADYAAARGAAERALAAEPESPAAWAALAEALLGLGDLLEASRALAQATERAPDHLAIGLLRADLFERQGQPQRAERELHRLVQLHPGDARARARLSAINLRLNRVQRAYAEIDTACRIDPDSAEFLLRRATLGVQVDRAQAAIDLQRLLERHPESPDVHHHLGLLAQGRGDLDAARAHYRGALALDPEYAAALAQLATILRSEGDLAAARELAQRAYTLQPKLPVAAAVLAALDLLDGEIDRARELIDQALAGPPFPGALVTRARLRRQTGQLEGALEDARAALRASPESALAYELLGDIHLDLANHEAARAAYRNALEIAPRSPLALLGMARSFQEQEDFEQVGVWSERLVAVEPDWAAAWVLRAMARTKAEQLDLALADIERALALQPDHVAGNFVLAGILGRLGRHAEVVARCERMLALPTDLDGQRAKFLALRDAAAAELE